MEKNEFTINLYERVALLKLDDETKKQVIDIVFWAMDKNSNLNNPQLTTMIFAILVKRLGGRVEITRADIDDISHNQLEEKDHYDGSFEFKLIEQQHAND